jgi:type IV secretory pathway protease TraF
MKRMKFQRYIHITVSCLALGLYWLILSSGVFINFSDKSMPAGIYKRTKQKPDRGSLAITCLTPEIAAYGLQRGYLNKGRCPTGIEPVMKIVMAMEGDTISIEYDPICYPHANRATKTVTMRVFLCPMRSK